MPCNTVQTSSVDLAVCDPAVLRDALRSAGWSGDVTKTPVYGIIDGRSIGLRFDPVKRRLSVSGTSDAGSVEAYVKRCYSQHLVATKARRYGWRVQQVSNGHLVLQR